MFLTLSDLNGLGLIGQTKAPTIHPEIVKKILAMPMPVATRPVGMSGLGQASQWNAMKSAGQLRQVPAGLSGDAQGGATWKGIAWFDPTDPNTVLLLGPAPFGGAGPPGWRIGPKPDSWSWIGSGPSPLASLGSTTAVSPAAASAPGQQAADVPDGMQKWKAMQAAGRLTQLPGGWEGDAQGGATWQGIAWYDPSDPNTVLLLGPAPFGGAGPPGSTGAHTWRVGPKPDSWSWAGSGPSPLAQAAAPTAAPAPAGPDPNQQVKDKIAQWQQQCASQGGTWDTTGGYDIPGGFGKTGQCMAAAPVVAPQAQPIYSTPVLAPQSQMPADMPQQAYQPSQFQPLDQPSFQAPSYSQAPVRAAAATPAPTTAPWVYAAAGAGALALAAGVWWLMKKPDEAPVAQNCRRNAR